MQTETTDVSSAVFVAIVRDDVQHLNGEGGLSNSRRQEERCDFAHEVDE